MINLCRLGANLQIEVENKLFLLLIKSYVLTVNAIPVNFRQTTQEQHNSFYVSALYVLRPLLFRSAVCSRKIEIVIVIVVPSHGLEPRTY